MLPKLAARLQGLRDIASPSTATQQDALKQANKDRKGALGGWDAPLQH
jgi:hypothetical protein